jgi:glycerophosphoryl diester phosphodiesterase
MKIGKEKYQNINALLNKKLEEKKLLIASHRGCIAGNIIGNTIPAFKSAFQMGADICEMDVIKSTDGIFYAFHDGGEPLSFHRDECIKTMSSAMIDSLDYYNSIGGVSNYHTNRVEEILRFFCHGELFNIDRAWDIFPELDQFLKGFPDVIRQVLLKAPITQETLEFLEHCEQKYMFMPIAYSVQDVKDVLRYQNINLVGIEMIAESQKDELFRQEVIDMILEQGLFTWVNAITLNGDINLYGNLDDDISIREAPEYGWGRLFEKKIQILQTDWPSIMDQYRKLYFHL